MRKFVPKPFMIDKFNETAWISIVLFTADQSNFRYAPSLFAYPTFKQLNVRTYVRFGDERGVYFCSLYTNDWLVAKGGRTFGLPFSQIQMSQLEMEKGLRFSIANDFCVNYFPKNKPYTPSKDSLEQFLTERYCIWFVRGKHIIKFPIHHENWTLQNVTVNLDKRESLLQAFPLLETQPIAHYAKEMMSYAHLYEKFAIYKN